MSVSSFSLLRIIVLLFFFGVIQSSAFADSGFYYVIYARLDMNDGTSRDGYFNLSSYGLDIERDSIGYYYHSVRVRKQMRFFSADSTTYGIHPSAYDHHFSNEVLFEMSMSDSIWVYDRIVLVQVPDQYSLQNDLVVAPLGKCQKLKCDQVKSITVKSIQQISTSAETSLALEDEFWLASQIVFQQDLGGGEICGYNACGFQKQTPGVHALLKELRKTIEQLEKLSNIGYAEANRRYTDFLEKLRQEHVLVMRFCSN